MAAVGPSSAASSRLRGEVRHGDAYELMGTLAPESVDLIITSPPYWGLRTYGQTHNAEILREWLAEDPDTVHSPPYEWYRRHGGGAGNGAHPGVVRGPPG